MTGLPDGLVATDVEQLAGHVAARAQEELCPS